MFAKQSTRCFQHPFAVAFGLLGRPVPEERAQALARVGAIVEEPRFYGHLTGRENLTVIAAARANETSLIRVLQAADSLMTRIQAGTGTIGMLASDSTLYRETTRTVIQFRELLTDIQAHPKKYLKISVF